MLEIIIPSISLFLVGLLLVLAGFRLRFKDTVVLHLTLFLAFGFSSLLIRLVNELGLIPLLSPLFVALAEIMLLAMILAFGALTLSFLNRQRSLLMSYWGAASVIIIWNILTFNIWGWGSIAFVPGIDNSLLSNIIGWAIAIGTALFALNKEFKVVRSAKYLNRLRYWLIATTLAGTSGLILFVNPAIFHWSGLPLIIISIILTSYVVLSYHTPDLNLLIGRAVYFVTSIGALTAIFFFGLAITIFAIRNGLLGSTSDFSWSILVAIFLAVITPFLWRRIRILLNRVIFGQKDRDAQQVIKHYSQTISGALDMHRLGHIILDLMKETLGIEQGIVFVNDKTSNSGVSLRPLASSGIENNLTTGYFSAASPFVNYFRTNEKFLHQYDIDVLPEFSQMSQEERTWLSSMGMELYVAIVRQRDLVGLLSFGPRSSGTAYYEEDIDLMIALAEQSALAMDSAQLFEQLAMVNRQVGLLNERMEGVDQNKNDFLAIASHELRTPLTKILGYSQMLLDLTEEELQDPEYVKAMTQGIAQGSERMKDVIDVMLDVTEADLGEMNLFKGPVSLIDVVAQASRQFISALDERRIAFAQNGIDTLPIVQADGTRLVQALENLISNAIKYTPDGGMVTLEGRLENLDSSSPTVELIVIDTGIGIDPEYHERIFEKVFRVDDADHHSTGKTKFKGAGPGLGLTLVKAIANAHGGKVWVESPGRDEVNYPGSRFYFIIPTETVDLEPDMRKQSQIETVHWRSKDLKPDQ